MQGSNAMNVRYTSVLDCFRQMVRAEGFGSLYKGQRSPIKAFGFEFSEWLPYSQFEQSSLFRKIYDMSSIALAHLFSI